MPLFHARPYTLIGGAVLALCSLSAQAAIEIDTRFDNLQLTVTDAAGNVTYPLLQATVDPLWALHSEMFYRAPEDSEDSYISSPLPTGDVPTVLSVSTPKTQFQSAIALNNNALTITQHIDTEPYTAGQEGHAHSHMEATLAPTIFAPGMSPNGSDPFDAPVFGGIALAPGSQATLTGTMSFESRLTFADGLQDLSLYDASATIDMLSSLMQIQEGATINDTIDVAAANGEIVNLNWYDRLYGSQGQNTPVIASESQAFTITVTNTTDVSSWLMVVSSANFNLNHNFYAPTAAVPEPGTWALMGLGLIGISAAARRRQRARV